MREQGTGNREQGTGNGEQRRGSALLIVLGMTAFMVISAVAFAAYMRHARQPSSFLRRTSYSRLLAKAALAEAIDIIDASIGDNPYPGLGEAGFPYPRVGGSPRNRNFWKNRVLTGTNEFVNTADTVSTLTFEGLAYLPPALINEARYYSRHSAAAVWHTLGFDAGRFAFTAVDVSDHFDINRTVANVGRSSSDAGRLSLAYILENKEHTGYTVQPSVWDEFMDDFVDAKKAAERGGYVATDNSGKLPLVSLADFNLALNDKKSDWVQKMSPFCRYFNSRGGTDFVTSSTGDDSEMMRLMTFVAGGYFPSTAGMAVTGSQGQGQQQVDDTDYDLTREENQPFKADELKVTTLNARSAFKPANESKAVTRLKESICGLGLCALWDYLDIDNVPLSLAIPTTERVPMVCAIEPKLRSAQLKVTEKKSAVTPENGYEDIYKNPTKNAKAWVTRTDTYTVDQQAFSAAFMGQVNALVAFPFRRNGELANDTFKIDGRLSLFLGASDLRFRTSLNDMLHLTAAEAGRGKDFRNGDQVVKNGIASAVLAAQDVPLTSTDGLQEMSFDTSGAAQSFSQWLATHPLVKVTYRWEQTYVVPEGEDEKNGTWEPEVPTDEKAALRAAVEKSLYPHCDLPPLKNDGTVNVDYLNDANFANILLNDGSVNLKVFAGVWLRIRNADGYLVDLVPACMWDDDNLNGCMNATAGGFSAYSKVIGGSAYPLMRFTCSDEFTFDLAALKAEGALAKGVDMAPNPAAVMVGDPRYNYAPEHWFVQDGAGAKATWLSACGVGVDGRDRDIFMATSDVGYLQSVYELAFLPRLTDLESCGNDQYYGNYVTPEDGRTEFATKFDDAQNAPFMWRTYRPFDLPNAPADDFEGVGFTSEGSGPRVNPFAATDSVLMGALANTPNSWTIASTNENAVVAISQDDRKAENFNKKYCFNEMGPAESKFVWEDLEKIAANLKTAMHRNDGKWKEGFRSLNWAGADALSPNADAAQQFCGVTLNGETCELSDVDRKFLYGYWRDSFANKQQLFLVFVRAEPMMMGGGAIGQTPPQLGARAVALVWRDPVKRGTDATAPHQTRVLFYRQFD